MIGVNSITNEEELKAFVTAAGLVKGDVYRSGDTLKIKTTD